MNELKIVATADGSNTIYNAEVGENYHSTHGALQESRHVFLNSGLRYYLERRGFDPPRNENLPRFDGSAPISILEVGFGTGLNFLLSADYCTENNIGLCYKGIEAYPLSEEMISNTGYDQYISTATWGNFINQYRNSLNGEVIFNSCCKLQTINCKLADFHSEQQFDIIYFDAFAVARQPEMWTDAAIAHTIQFLKPGGLFVTYAITGNLKRALKALGCKVEKAKGAPGKREMLRAVKV
jgi:tRNA U34 5-methylaminomethyl-2-thiouridine-forming methyltransferase MnmC